MTARRYRKIGRQRFGSMGKVWACGQKRNKWRRRSSSASSPRPACRVKCIYESGVQRHFEGHRLGRDAARLAARLLADQQRQKILRLARRAETSSLIACGGPGGAIFSAPVLQRLFRLGQAVGGASSSSSDGPDRGAAPASLSAGVMSARRPTLGAGWGG